MFQRFVSGLNVPGLWLFWTRLLLGFQSVLRPCDSSNSTIQKTLRFQLMKKREFSKQALFSSCKGACLPSGAEIGWALRKLRWCRWPL